ncbi:uncharacterized protein LOC135844518 [Planococcus citri]|uniref:uncharacterized protein LOC135844518 n=1 Tax=Planococcus citri TaxID=170843 RepID=UPI0031F9DBE5
MSSNYAFNVFFILLGSLFVQSLADMCMVNNDRINCPGPKDQLNYTHCCMHENSTETFCCLNRNHHHEHYDRLVMLVSITVISSCLAISFLIIICCFWSRCPLFYSCRVNYAQRGIIAYSKEEEALNQPPDENDYCHQYTPVNVKICKVNDI